MDWDFIGSVLLLIALAGVMVFLWILEKRASKGLSPEVAHTHQIVEASDCHGHRCHKD